MPTPYNFSETGRVGPESEEPNQESLPKKEEQPLEIEVIKGGKFDAPKTESEYKESYPTFEEAKDNGFFEVGNIILFNFWERPNFDIKAEVVGYEEDTGFPKIKFMFKDDVKMSELKDPEFKNIYENKKWIITPGDYTNFRKVE